MYRHSGSVVNKVRVKLSNVQITVCEHFPCYWVYLGDTGCVCVLLELEPVLDSPHGPKALVMRRPASSNLRGGPTCLACFGGKCEHFFEQAAAEASHSRETWSFPSSSNSEAWTSMVRRMPECPMAVCKALGPTPAWMDRAAQAIYTYSWLRNHLKPKTPHSGGR